MAANRLCAQCGAESPVGSRFCGACGQALGGGGCSDCGFPNPPDHRFCGRCGSALHAADPEPVTASTPGPGGERKLVTVLFADVVGFTAMSENTDPEVVARTVDRAFRRMAEVVVEHGGTVDKYMGDCLMALFGVPHAHENDAERAVATALAIRDLGGELQFSIGLNSGEVMVTAVGRDGDPTVIGDTVNVAARLEKTAGAGEILLGALTAELAGRRVVLRPREPALLKGKREPVPVWEAVALRADDAAPAGAESVPLVGRDVELTFLRAIWRRVVASRRANLVRISGEAGIGKTRLLDELARSLRGESRVVRTRYPAYGTPSGPRIAGEVVRQLGQLGETDVDDRLAALARTLPGPDGMAPSKMRQEYVWALRRLARTHADVTPLLLIIDDMHRAGEEALDLLAEVVPRDMDSPILLVLAGHSEPADWLRRLPDYTALSLTPLQEADATVLLDSLLPELPLDPASAEQLVTRAGGNPLYLRELVRLLQARAGLVPSSGAYHLAQRAALPATLQSVLAARLDALPGADKAALQHLSMFADGAGEAELIAVGLASPAEGLRRLVAAGLVRRRDDGGHAVVDPLLREVAYETMPHDLRARRHRLAAAVVTDAGGAAHHLDTAARHLPADTELQQLAATALGDAGLRLLNTHRHAEGTGLLLRAVELGLRDPDILLRLAHALLDISRGDEALPVLELVRVADGDEQRATDLLHTRANAISQRAPAEALPLYAEARRRWAALGNTRKEAWAVANAAYVRSNTGDIETAVRGLDEAVVLFERAGDRWGATSARGLLAVWRPEDPRVGEWLEAALGSAEELRDLSQQRDVRIALTWHHFIRSRWGGDADTAEVRAHAGRLAELAAGLGDVANEAQARAVLTYLARMGGRWEEAERLSLSLRRRPVEGGSSIETLVGAVLVSLDLPARAAEPMQLSRPVRTADPLSVLAAAIEAEALAFAGRADEAWEHLERRGHVAPAALGAVLVDLCAAMVLTLLGRHDEAISRLEPVLPACEAIHAGPARTAARALLAEGLLAGGDRAGARALVEATNGQDSGGLAGALALRAHARLGVPGAAAQLEAAARALRAPGLSP